jgi:signal peptidase I
MPAQVFDTAAKRPAADPERDHKKRKRLNFFLEIATLFGALGVGLMIRFSVYETMIVTSGSMESTLGINDRFLVDHRQILHGEWKRGDIITFDEPESWGDEHDTLVKRVIGLPGESVTVQNGTVYINNKRLDEPYLNEAPNSEFLGPFNLKPGQYFVMGDNRNHSDDSRDNGPIEDKDIRGRVVLRLWPVTKVGTLPAVNYSF